MINPGLTELGLGGNGNLSAVPVFGGVIADSDNVGSVLSFLRAHTLGESGVEGIDIRIDIEEDVVRRNAILCSVWNER